MILLIAWGSGSSHASVWPLSVSIRAGSEDLLFLFSKNQIWIWFGGSSKLLSKISNHLTIRLRQFLRPSATQAEFKDLLLFYHFSKNQIWIWFGGSLKLLSKISSRLYSSAAFFLSRQPFLAWIVPNWSPTSLGVERRGRIRRWRGEVRGAALGRGLRGTLFFGWAQIGLIYRPCCAMQYCIIPANHVASCNHI